MTAVDTFAGLRRTGIGGSDAAAICGLSKYKSPLGVYYQKTGQLTDDGAGEAAYWGTILEEPVADEFARRTNLDIRVGRPFVRHPNVPYMFANPDREIPDVPSFLEVKTTSAWLDADWEDGPPDAAQVQGLHYMDVLEVEHCYFAVLIGGQKYAHFKMDRDDRAIGALRKVEAEFWGRVENGDPPPADASAATTAALQHVFARVERPSVVLGPEAADWIISYKEAHADEKIAKAIKDDRGNKLRQALGDAEEGWLDGDCVVTCKAVPETPVAATVRKAHRRLNVKGNR